LLDGAIGYYSACGDQGTRTKSHAAVNGWRVQAARRAQSVAVVHVQPWRALFSDGHSQPQVGGACAQRHGISAARKLLWLTHSSGVRNRVHAATTVASNDPRASFTTRLGHGRGAPQDLTYWHCLDDEQWRKSERTRVEATTKQRGAQCRLTVPWVTRHH
jgi:hypothetical protein